MATVNPDELQSADIVPIRILIAVGKTNDQVSQLVDTIKALNEMLASHMRSNLEMIQKIDEYISSQSLHRSVREELEEHRLRTELEQKNIELQFMKHQVDELTEENTQADQLRLSYEKLKLEKEALQSSLDILKTIKGNTKDKIKAAAPAKLSWEDIKRAIVLGVVGTLAASLTGGTIAFILWGLRQWLLSGAGP